MATGNPDPLYTPARITGTIAFLEVPTITRKYTPVGDDCTLAPIAASPLDEYRGAGSLALRRIRTLGADGPANPDPSFKVARARSLLREAYNGITNILGAGHPLSMQVADILFAE